MLIENTLEESQYENVYGTELIANTHSIISPIQVPWNNSQVKVKDFDHDFQDTYLGRILNGGGTACIYELKSDTRYC